MIILQKVHFLIFTSFLCKIGQLFTQDFVRLNEIKCKALSMAFGSQSVHNKGHFPSLLFLCWMFINFLAQTWWLKKQKFTHSSSEGQSLRRRIPFHAYRPLWEIRFLSLWLHCSRCLPLPSHAFPLCVSVSPNIPLPSLTRMPDIGFLAQPKSGCSNT